MSINLTTEDGYVKVQASGAFEDLQQGELLDPAQARDMASRLEMLADRAEADA